MILKLFAGQKSYAVLFQGKQGTRSYDPRSVFIQSFIPGILPWVSISMPPPCLPCRLTVISVWSPSQHNSDDIIRVTFLFLDSTKLLQKPYDTLYQQFSNLWRFEAKQCQLVDLLTQKHCVTQLFSLACMWIKLIRKNGGLPITANNALYLGYLAIAVNDILHMELVCFRGLAAASGHSKYERLCKVRTWLGWRTFFRKKFHTEVKVQHSVLMVRVMSRKQRKSDIV